MPYVSPEQLRLNQRYLPLNNTLLFHGTCESFAPEELKGGGYDKIIWTCNHPDIAQCYIPESEATLHVPATHFNNPRAPIETSGPLANMAINKLGYRLAPEIDEYPVDIRDKAVNCWRKGDQIQKPTYGEIQEYLTEILGYTVKDWAFRLKMKGEEVMPNSYFIPGRLFMIQPVNPDYQPRFLDMRDHEGDLNDPQYNRFDWFEIMRRDGYDGIIIEDYAQSTIHGNYGHTSYGLNPDRLNLFQWSFIDAVRQDSDDLGRTIESPALIDYLASRNVIPLSGFSDKISINEATFNKVLSFPNGSKQHTIETWLEYYLSLPQGSVNTDNNGTVLMSSQLSEALKKYNYDAVANLTSEALKLTSTYGVKYTEPLHESPLNQNTMEMSVF